MKLSVKVPEMNSNHSIQCIFCYISVFFNCNQQTKITFESLNIMIHIITLFYNHCIIIFNIDSLYLSGCQLNS